jgi:hypothetical protein
MNLESLIALTSLMMWFSSAHPKLDEFFWVEYEFSNMYIGIEMILRLHALSTGNLLALRKRPNDWGMNV